MLKSVTNAPGIFIQDPIDPTDKVGGGSVSVGACVVQAPKGRPNVVLNVNASNWQDILGKPYPAKVGGTKMEGLRHLADALIDCESVNVVRVLADDALYPGLVMDDEGAVTTPTYSFPVTAHACAAGEILSIWVVDGDPSDNRTVSIGTFDATKERFTITFSDLDADGKAYVLESYVVGVKQTDLDDMGLSAFIETVLENNASRFRCEYNEAFTFTEFNTAAAIGFATAQGFEDGTDGGTPTTEDWEAAWDLFRHDDYSENIMFAAGNYDTDVLANCLEIAEHHHCTFLFDVSPALMSAAGISWLNTAGLENRQGAVYHAPIMANDKFYGKSSKTVWGVSGEMAASVARCNSIYTGETPGVHYAPAGERRGKLQRTGIVFLHPGDGQSPTERLALYDARINPIVPSISGGAVCDDVLSLYFKSNYERFLWVNRIANFIDHRIYEAALTVKFEPDGITRDRLTDLATDVMEAMVASGALVAPRNSDQGTEPYVITVEQLQIDLWQLTYEFCPTGSARRIIGQPVIIK